MKTFSQFLIEEAEKEVFFTFGRFNPPTIGHEKLLDKLASVARGKTYRVYASHSVDAKKNPLEYADKIKWMRKLFPRHARSIVEDKANNVFEICSELYKQGFTKVTMVAGSDRVLEFQTLLNKYNGKQLQTGFYNFGSIDVVSAGERDPDADGAMGMSSSKMRAAASSNDLTAFHKGLPSGFKDDEALFNAVRSGMGLKESRNFRKHIQLETLSERREAYVAGEMFNVNDTVVIKESQEIGTISGRGSNYLVLEMSDGRKLRKWLNDVELLESSEDWEEFSPSLHTLGIPREEMPQIKADKRNAFLEFLKKSNVSSEDTSVDPKSLMPTQKEYSPSKVQGAIEFGEKNPDLPQRPILVSVDGHILDGHHQWCAHLQNGVDDMRVYKLSAPIKELLHYADVFLNGSETVKESFTTIQAPVVVRTPSRAGRPISAIRSSFKQ